MFTESDIKKVYIELTSCCNLNCEMCFRRGWFQETTGFMSDAMLESLLSQIEVCRNTETVVFGGVGEPTLHKGLVSAVERLSAAGKTAWLTTNATLLSHSMLEGLVKAGIGRIWISVDGISFADYAHLRRGSDYSALINTIEEYNTLRAGTDCRLGFTYTVTKENVRGLKGINAFARKFGADLLNISHTVPATPTRREDCLFGERINVGLMEQYSENYVQRAVDRCEFIESGSVFVRWDGEVSPCLPLLHNNDTYLYENKRRIFKKSFGNIENEALLSIYNSEAYKAFRERVSRFDFPSCTACLGCDLRDTNETDCAYNEFPTCGGCLWSQGIVFCP